MLDLSNLFYLALFTEPRPCQNMSLDLECQLANEM